MVFIYPPFYSFAPFFTIQPNVTTRSKQLELWANIICSYCEDKRLFALDISDASKSELWRNNDIDRKLNSDGLKR